MWALRHTFIRENTQVHPQWHWHTHTHCCVLSPQTLCVYVCVFKGLVTSPCVLSHMWRTLNVSTQTSGWNLSPGSDFCIDSLQSRWCNISKCPAPLAAFLLVRGVTRLVVMSRCFISRANHDTNKIKSLLYVVVWSLEDIFPPSFSTLYILIPSSPSFQEFAATCES